MSDTDIYPAIRAEVEALKNAIIGFPPWSKERQDAYAALNRRVEELTRKSYGLGAADAWSHVLGTLITHDPITHLLNEEPAE